MSDATGCPVGLPDVSDCSGYGIFIFYLQISFESRANVALPVNQSVTRMVATIDVLKCVALQCQAGQGVQATAGAFNYCGDGLFIKVGRSRIAVTQSQIGDQWIAVSTECLVKSR